jgi:hypothetical protein
MAVTWTGADADPTRLSTTEGVVYAGLNKDSSAAVNMAALKAAIAATPVGGTLVIPPVTGGGVYAIDTSGGLSAAAVLDKKMTLQIDGTLQSSDGAMGANPPYIFKVTGDEVTITGKGCLKGSGAIDDTNAGDETTFPGLIYVTGDKFTLTLAMIDTPPKLGVLLYDCYDAVVSVPRWKGGVVTYTPGNTAYFGVRATGGGRHKIVGNNWERDATDGRFITGVFSGGIAGNSADLFIEGNTADVHEKLAYLYGDRHTVVGNRVREAPQTDIIRIHGSYNKVLGNYGYNIKAGVNVFDGVMNEVSDNTFLKVHQIGVWVAKSVVGYSGGFGGTRIRGNKIIAGAEGGYSLNLQDGIRVEVDGVTSTDLDISGNYVQGFAPDAGQGLIRVRAVAPYAVTDSRITGNLVSDSTRNGIVIDRVTHSEIAHNQGRNLSEYFLAEVIDSGYNLFLHNSGQTLGSIGIQGLAATSYGEGNRYTEASLTGTATLSVAASHAVNHDGVAPNALILIVPTNAAAAAAIASKGLLPAVSGVDLTIATGDGSNWGGTETVRYQLVQ